MTREEAVIDLVNRLVAERYDNNRNYCVIPDKQYGLGKYEGKKCDGGCDRCINEYYTKMKKDLINEYMQ